MNRFFLLSSLMILTMGAANAQTFVSTTPSNKNVVLEEFTGIGCTFCPDGHRIAQQLITNNPGRVIAINVHTGDFAIPSLGQPDYRTAFGSSLAAQSGLRGYPAGTINRRVFLGTTTALSRSDWTASVATALAQSSPVNIAARGTLDMSTRQLVVEVEAYYTANSAIATNKLNVAILQNGILGPQTGMSANPAQIVGSLYEHTHMLRHFLTGQWGEDITATTQGSVFNKTYTYTLPASYTNIPADPINIEVVVYIAEGNQEILTGTKAVLTLSTSVVNDVSLVKSSQGNLSCFSMTKPVATIQNLGSAPITAASFDVMLNGIASQYNWTAPSPLTLGQSVDVEIPNVLGTRSGSNSYRITATIANDATSTNNIKTGSFSVKPTKLTTSNNSNFSLSLGADEWGKEISWKWFGPNGTVLASGGPYPQTAAPTPGVQLFNENLPATTSGCYEFRIYDSAGDGIRSGSPTQSGQGYYYIIGPEMDTLYRSLGTYGALDYIGFDFTSTLSNEEASVAHTVLKPNPNNGSFVYEFTNETALNTKVTVLNLLGQEVAVLLNEKVAGFRSLNISLDNLQNGTYFLTLKTETGQIKSERFSVIK